RDGSIERVSRCLIGFGVKDRELRLVVKHLLEVWYAPAVVGGIAMEATANLVMNPTAGHGTQVVQHHVEHIFGAGSRPVPQQEQGARPAGGTGGPPRTRHLPHHTTDGSARRSCRATRLATDHPRPLRRSPPAVTSA